ncbi:hypothetical protein TNCT_105971 [Trichonephila clavata]|uniref:Uncharacterized protein n=1 Tax=Trichonephila clavata TaxID=2740835 RepID=A0A8X6KEC0_TRICU|nr:hypothetical protein TNCT_105971 [Trichonephila clavata]
MCNKRPSRCINRYQCRYSSSRHCLVTESHFHSRMTVDSCPWQVFDEESRVKNGTPVMRYATATLPSGILAIPTNRYHCQSCH